MRGFIWSVRLAGRAIREGLGEFYRSDNMTFASSIAYYSILSMFPFLLIVLAVMGMVRLGDGGGTLLGLVGRAVPAHLDFLVSQIQALGQIRLRVGVAGFLLALWGSMGLFGAITSAINHAWGVERRPGFWKHKLIALTMLGVAAVLLMVTLVLMSWGQMLRATWFANAVGSVPGVAWLGGVAVQNLPTPLAMVVMGLMYYYVPNTRVRLRDVWWGAVVAGLLWRVAFAGFQWWVSDLSRFTVHGQVAAVAVFLVWIYLSAVIFLYGAEVSASFARLCKADGYDGENGKPTGR